MEIFLDETTGTGTCFTPWLAWTQIDNDNACSGEIIQAYILYKEPDASLRERIGFFAYWLSFHSAIGNHILRDGVPVPSVMVGEKEGAF